MLSQRRRDHSHFKTKTKPSSQKNGHDLIWQQRGNFVYFLFLKETSLQYRNMNKAISKYFLKLIIVGYLLKKPVSLF